MQSNIVDYKMSKHYTTQHQAFFYMCQTYGLPIPETEYRFHQTRLWRFDYAWPEHKIALEVEGGIWIRGRHTRGKGFSADIEKYNQANLLGWHVFKCVPKELLSHKTVEMIRKGMKEEKS